MLNSWDVMKGFEDHLFTNITFVQHDSATGVLLTHKGKDFSTLYYSHSRWTLRCNNLSCNSNSPVCGHSNGNYHRDIR